MARFRFYVVETLPEASAARDETDADRRDQEAARLEIAPVQAGDDPPTVGDEGGGTFVRTWAREDPGSTGRPLPLVGRQARSVLRRFLRSAITRLTGSTAE